MSTPDSPSVAPPSGGALPFAALVTALVIPPLFAFNMTPSPTLLNQLLCVAGWGAYLAVLRGAAPFGAIRRPLALLMLAFALLMAGVVASWALGSLPTSLAMPPLGLLAAACVLAVSAARLARGAGGTGIEVFLPFAVGLLAAGLLSTVVAILQVFWPSLPDGDWIARSGLPGRAVGNLRQPNHLASLLMWAFIALVPLVEWGKIPRWLGSVLGAALALGVILSGSRTGQYGGLGVLVLWGLADALLAHKRWVPPSVLLSRTTRWSLIVGLPVVALLLWFGVAAIQDAHNQAFGARNRLAEGDSSHFAIWKNAFEMLLQQPWQGVGWGEFNFAWTMTPFPGGRPTAFFDHTHDLPLQLVVELGLPVGGLVILLLLAVLVQGARRAWSQTGPVGHGARAAWVIVVMIAAHSLDEYPLWYAYFLLPAAWALGFALGAGQTPAAAGTPSPVRGVGAPWLRGVGVAMFALAAVAAWDYHRISQIFEEDEDLPPLAKRIAAGERSPLFAHHADYADATTTEPVALAMPAIGRAAHALIDTRLMIAWANALEARHEDEKARYVVDRLREFHKDDAATFFAPCTDPAVKTPPFQCLPPPPAGKLTWRDLLTPAS